MCPVLPHPPPPQWVCQPSVVLVFCELHPPGGLHPVPVQGGQHGPLGGDPADRYPSQRPAVGCDYRTPPPPPLAPRSHPAPIQLSPHSHPVLTPLPSSSHPSLTHSVVMRLPSTHTHHQHIRMHARPDPRPPPPPSSALAPAPALPSLPPSSPLTFAPWCACLALCSSQHVTLSCLAALLLCPLSAAGNLGRFNFQVFLLSLVSSVALLAASSAVVKFLAFHILPNRCVYSG
jgi:hypothetical protein